MARSRNIKPAFFDNDELAELEPLARILFIGMWTIADFKGDFEWRSKRVKAKLLPYDDCNINDLAVSLDKSGFIKFYSDGNFIYCNVVNFTTHQNPHKNERLKGSGIPSYSKEYRQAIDLKELTINRDKSRLIRNNSHTNPADSLNLIPDSCNLIPDSLDKEPLTNKNTCANAHSSFDDFWLQYPTKRNKKASRAIWIKKKLDSKSDLIINDVINRSQNDSQWSKGYIPHPSTYFKQM